MIEVTVTVKRDKGETKTYQLTHSSNSKGGIPIFSPAAETPDLPSFDKLYVKAERDVVKGNGVKKS